MILEAVAAPLTGGMQILKVGKMVSLVGADEETFKRVPWIPPAWYGITQFPHRNQTGKSIFGTSWNVFELLRV